MITDLQKRTCQAIVNIFETSRALGDYASVVFHPLDPGQLTYGRSQTTLASGNLFLQSPLMEGEDVRKVQIALGREGFSVDTDGIFGQKTETAVKVFQSRAGLTDDGIVGRATRSALGL